MRSWLPALAVGLVVGLAWHGRAQENDARAIVERGIRALGGEERILKYRAGRLKARGKLEILGGIGITQETAYQMPDKFRQAMEMDVMGRKIVVVTTYDGKKGAIEVDGQKRPATDKILQALREGAHQMHVGRLVPLRDKGYELSTLGEVQVNGKPALGVRVAKADHADVNLYFDKKSGLPVKVEARAPDFMTGQEVTEERIITEYQTIDNTPVAKTVEVLRDGKRFMEAQVIEAKFFERIDDSEFAVP